MPGRGLLELGAGW